MVALPVAASSPAEPEVDVRARAIKEVSSEYEARIAEISAQYGALAALPDDALSVAPHRGGTARNGAFW